MKLLFLTATAALALTAPVAAQDYGRGDDPAMRAPPSDAGYGPPAPAPSNRGGPGDLHAALRMRPDQEDAWRTLNAQTAPDAQRAAEARGDAGRIARMTTPQRLAFTQAQMQRDMEEFSRRAVIIRGFYAQLTPEQRSTFDRLTGPSPDEGRGYRGPPPR